MKLSVEYETEQKDLQKQADEFQKETAEFDRQQTDFNQFRYIVQKYVGLTGLTPTIAGEFVPPDEFIPDKKEIPRDYF